MPWCDACDRYLTPTSLDDGTCPLCDSDEVLADDVAAPVGRKLPWHFKLMMALVVIYLSWRVVILAVTVVEWAF